MRFITPTLPSPNADENIVASEIPFIGNFHKSLPHNKFGEVVPSVYRLFERACVEVEAGSPGNFERVPQGNLAAHVFEGGRPKSVARLTSPLSGASTETLGPDPKSLEMMAAPSVLSSSSAAEITELYWMALLRDVPLASFAADPQVANATAELDAVFGAAVASDVSEGALKPGLDLPMNVGAGGINLQTVFRAGLQDEDLGPLVSQFFLRDIPYGVQTISSSQRPYVEKRDFLVSYDDWIRAQDTGYDRFGRGYSACNFFADDAGYYAVESRKISTMRDLARFVNRDALHQAYFNAALFLDFTRANLDEGNPYRGARYSREGDFATLGAPDLLSLVSEVASRALKVVWRQKWLVHRRARPEAYAGLVQMQFQGHAGERRPYGLPEDVITTQAARGIKRHNEAQPRGAETYFLPLAFSAGSPTHPAYGAGHATVAGACVTVLKAWFEEEQTFADLLTKAQLPERKREPVVIDGLLQPGTRNGPDRYTAPTAYAGGDANRMTVGGELNKLAANVMMGRSMGGVHWRSDNTRSLRLGEQIAFEILRKRTMEYAERPVSFNLRSFDRERVRISEGRVHYV